MNFKQQLLVLFKRITPYYFFLFLVLIIFSLGYYHLYTVENSMKRVVLENIKMNNENIYLKEQINLLNKKLASQNINPMLNNNSIDEYTLLYIKIALLILVLVGSGFTLYYIIVFLKPFFLNKWLIKGINSAFYEPNSLVTALNSKTIWGLYYKVALTIPNTDKGTMRALAKAGVPSDTPTRAHLNVYSLGNISDKYVEVKYTDPLGSELRICIEKSTNYIDIKIKDASSDQFVSLLEYFANHSEMFPEYLNLATEILANVFK